jgi:general secretion pathway protein L
LIFQDSIGIEIKENEVVLAFLRQTFKGVRLAAHSVYAVEDNMSKRELLEEIRSYISEFREENQIHTANLVMGLSNGEVILREIEYPMAVKENLQTTLIYDIDKYIPLPADEIYFDHQVIEEDRMNNQLKILLAVIKKRDCEPYLSFCRQWPGGVFGLCLSAVAAVNCYAFLSGKRKSPLNGRVREILMQPGDVLSDREVFQPSHLHNVGIPSSDLIPAFGLGLEVLWEAPIRINLLPQEVRKKPSRKGIYTLIGLVSLLILSIATCGGGYLYHRQLQLRLMEGEAKRLSLEVMTVTEMQERIKEIEARLETIREISEGEHSAVDILRELTQVIPDNTWVTEFRLMDKGIQLTGYAESASELIPLLEESPLFEDVAFRSAITKDAKQNKYRFVIGLNPVSLKEKEE